MLQGMETPQTRRNLARSYTTATLCPTCVTVDDPADCPTCNGSRLI